MRNLTAMTRLTALALVLVVLGVAGCARPTSAEWSADDSQRAAGVLADSLLEARWRDDLPPGAEPSVALDVSARGAEERVDAELILIELRKRLVGGGMSLQTDPAQADYVLAVALRKAEDAYGDWLYVADASLVQRAGGAIAWADAVQVRKRQSNAPATPAGKASLMHNRRQAGDRVGSYPANQGTNRTVNLHVTKPEVDESQLVRDLAELRRIDGVRSIQEQVDERGTARLLVYVLPHRELEVRQRLLDQGWLVLR
jgi:hypothetical protein